MQGFGAGLACGIGCGMGAGIAIGMGSGQSMVHKKLKGLLADGAISVNDRDGKSLSGDELIALLSGKRKRN